MRISDLVERILLINILLFFFLGGLFFISETSWTYDGSIRHSVSGYTAHNIAGSEDKGRITGRAKNAPDFNVTVFTTVIQPVMTAASTDSGSGDRRYEVMLEPGTYILTVDAEGYSALSIRDLEVRAGEDLELDLKFSRKPS